MPIRINLLAEAQAAEEARRKDPVKRGIWIGGLLVCLVLLYIGNLYAEIVIERISYQRLEAQWKRLAPKSGVVTTNQTRIAVIDRRLAELNRLSTNRFYWGTVLNNLQQTTVDDIQLTGFHGVQEYSVTNAVPAKEVDGKKVPRVPGVSIERISISLDGKDWNYGQQTYEKYRVALSGNDFFNRNSAGRGFRLGTTLGTPMPDALNPAHSYVTFTLECRFQEAVRRE